MRKIIRKKTLHVAILTNYIPSFKPSLKISNITLVKVRYCLFDSNTSKHCIMSTKFVLVLGLCSILLAACQKDNKGNQLDIQLNAALFNASDGLGRDYFKLPDNRDFNKIPQDPQNPLTTEKVELGKMLFHETGLAVKPKDAVGLKTYSCASCHFAGAGFQAGVKQGLGDGGMGFGVNGEGRFHNTDYPADSVDVQPLRTPSAMHGAYQKNLLWNGQFGATGTNSNINYLWEGLSTISPLQTNELGFEGLETQAIAGLSVHRMDCNEEMVEGGGYMDLFDAAFPDVPTTERYDLKNAGLAIAAYERTLLANRSPFQKWLSGNELAMSNREKKGAILFFETANCAQCHTGPALNSMEFHAYGMDDLSGNNVIGYNPENPAHKGRASFTQEENDEYKFKVPQLYNLTDSPFYGHGGSFTSVRDVVVYKNKGQSENSAVPASKLSSELRPLQLSEQEIDDLTLFLEYSLRDPDLQRYQPTTLPSGNCFPNGDEVSMVDLGCE